MATVTSGLVRFDAVPDAGTITISQSPSGVTPVAPINLGMSTGEGYFIMNFSSVEGLTYTLQASEFPDGPWIDVPAVDPVIGNGAPIQISVAILATIKSFFYRLKVE